MTILDSLVEGALCLGNRRESNELLGMMVRYLVTGEVPEPRTDAQRMAITMIMPVLENSRARAEAGRKGGQSKGKPESKPESKRASKTESKPESKPESKRASEEEGEGEEELGVWINPSDCENEGGGGAEFVPPTLEEVKTYFAVNCLRGSASKFYDYYESNGWTRQGFPHREVGAGRPHLVRPRARLRRRAQGPRRADLAGGRARVCVAAREDG